jgi:4-hydroxy-4-methyl-2-oxoglutarate aldolase
VVVVPRLDAGETLDAARRRQEKEAATRVRLQGGELGLDIYGLRQTLETLGVEYLEHGDGPPG